MTIARDHDGWRELRDTPGSRRIADRRGEPGPARGPGRGRRARAANVREAVPVKRRRA